MSTPPLPASCKPANAKALRHLRASDPVLAHVIDVVGRPVFATDADHAAHGMTEVYPTLVRSIVSQQLSTKAAATIHRRLLALFAPDEDAAPATPEPEQLLAASPELLRTAGISGSKALALHDLAAKVLDGTVPDHAEAEHLGDDELIARLSAVRGIGVWTVQMLLIFRLGRGDVLPTGDLGVRKGVQRAFDLDAQPTPTEVLRRGEPWAPYRTWASWYLWRAADPTVPL